MGMPKATKPRQKTVSSASAGYSTVLEGPIMLAYGASNLMIAGFFRALSGPFKGKVRYRTFKARKENPDAWVDFGTDKVAAGQFVEAQSLAAITGKMWIQAGIAAASSTAGTVGEAEAYFQAFTEDKGQVIAARTYDIEPDLNATKSGIYPLGDPFPSAGLTGIMVAGSILGVNGTLKLNFTYREFTSDPKLPGAWSTSLLTDASITTDQDYNSLNMPITPGAATSLVQVGVVIPANDARANLDLVLAAKYG